MLWELLALLRQHVWNCPCTPPHPVLLSRAPVAGSCLGSLGFGVHIVVSSLQAAPPALSNVLRVGARGKDLSCSRMSQAPLRSLSMLPWCLLARAVHPSVVRACQDLALPAGASAPVAVFPSQKWALITFYFMFSAWRFSLALGGSSSCSLVLEAFVCL